MTGQAGAVRSLVSPFADARLVLQRAVATRACPAAVVEVGNATQCSWREAFGRLTFAKEAPVATERTVFDLASLTKVLATAPLLMQLIERGRMELDDAVSSYRPEWSDSARASVTLRDLLSHSSGLPAWRPLFQECEGRAAFERAIDSLPLEYEPRTKSLYSDLGFMLLGFLVDDPPGMAGRFDALLTQMGIVEDLQFLPPRSWKDRTAPTEQDQWRGRLLVGEVHDENAWALGGAGGHAGLFGTVASVGGYARHLLQILDGRLGAFRKDTLEIFTTRRTDIPGSSRALAWDTMLPTSSCGTRMSASAFGHTGFTGTSLWIDPVRGVYVVLLTNRVHPTRANDAIAGVRRALHDAVMAAV